MVLIWCLLYSRHVQSTQKEQINNHKVVAGHVVVEGDDFVTHKVLLSKDLVVYKILLSGYCSKFQQC